VSGERILIVDGTMGLRLLEEGLLKGYGYPALRAKNGAEGIKLLLGQSAGHWLGKRRHSE
jgi:CheY-like chemotaxis protein